MPYWRGWSSGQRPPGRRIVVMTVIAVMLGVGMGALIVPQFRSAMGIASNVANVAACATPAPATATAAPSAMAAATAAPSATAATTATATPSAMAAATATATPSAMAAATATAAATPSASVLATPTICPSASATASALASASAAAPASPAAAVAANVSCDIIVPANPLTAAGLATPYQLTGPGGMTAAQSGCTMTNFANLGAFVQATILNPATGALSVYEPLVITQGTTPAAPPVMPTLPPNAVVTIDFGFNGTNLTQVGATPTALAQGRCVNGLNGSIFGQVSFCNGTGFFRAAFRAERQGLLTIPAVGTSPKTGQPCPTTRSFTMIDQDQSDNVTTLYLLNANGQTAQLNAANTAVMPNAAKIGNGSDNLLLNGFLDPALGCMPFTAPDLSQAGAAGTSQALDELSAAKNQAAPIALVPENDEMVLVNNAFSVQKTNLYRSQVGQPRISAATAADSPANYCQNMVNIQAPFLNTNQAMLATGASPVATVGTNLLTFLANRLNMSFTNLNCQNFGLKNPVTVTLNGVGAATAATFDVTPQMATGTAATGGPAPGRRLGRSHHGLMDPSGM